MYRENYVLGTPVSSDFSFLFSNTGCSVAVPSREMEMHTYSGRARSETSSRMCSPGRWSVCMVCSSVTNSHEWAENQLPEHGKPWLVVPHLGTFGVHRLHLLRAPQDGTP